MASPLYLVSNGIERKLVPYPESIKLGKQGYETLQVVPREDAESFELNMETIEPSEIEISRPERIITPQFVPVEKPAIVEIETPVPEVEIETKDIEVKEKVKPEKVQKAKLTKKAKTKTKTKAKAKKTLKCEHCGVTARTQAAYDRNHGDKCFRK